MPATGIFALVVGIHVLRRVLSLDIRDTISAYKPNWLYRADASAIVLSRGNTAHCGFDSRFLETKCNQILIKAIKRRGRWLLQINRIPTGHSQAIHVDTCSIKTGCPKEALELWAHEPTQATDVAGITSMCKRTSGNTGRPLNAYVM